ncbi:hypothetical protein [Pararhodobacter sp. CCB-MM2]|uniref:hypothetical protein n=1 Tax=Pararhodobacter sp. CCB-MM2 TaxID=1786003 RepID=UPI00082E3B79|nr:hypothetical protein [Pararhodobacter sp. CCB-MM2]
MTIENTDWIIEHVTYITTSGIANVQLIRMHNGQREFVIVEVPNVSIQSGLEVLLHKAISLLPATSKPGQSESS